ncbi:MAG TPA: VanW family protein [Bacillota bacterium]
MRERGGRRRGSIVVLTVAVRRYRPARAGAVLIAALLALPALGLLSVLARSGAWPGLWPGGASLHPPAQDGSRTLGPPAAGSPAGVAVGPGIPDQCDPPGWPDPSLYGLFAENEAPWAGFPRQRLEQQRRAAGAARWLAGFRVTLPEPLFEEPANLRRAAALLAGTVVEPGAAFSLNTTIGPYTRDRGYRPGPSYVGGRLVPTDGGGVCKVATALYNAVIHSGLTVLERHAHSMIVPYVAPGRDAAVVYGAKDFRFRNDAGSPVVLWSEVRDLTLFVAVYGSHQPPEVTWHQRVLARQEPWTLRPYNPELGPGEERVLHEGFPGFTVRTWLTVAYPDRSPERRDLGVDTYQPLPRVIEHGP